ncbi:MAG: PilZ domain-containing protein [Micrococcales bacterium]|nr:PilZ domain-containing protein [Micrococcales bacterium]
MLSTYGRRPWRRFRRDRYEVRKAYASEVELVTPDWDEPVGFAARDLSPGGVFVATDLALDPGSELVVSFWVPECPGEITVFGEVVRVCLPRRRTDHFLAGMGVRFLDISPLERLYVRDALRGVPPPLPVG